MLKRVNVGKWPSDERMRKKSNRFSGGKLQTFRCARKQESSEKVERKRFCQIVRKEGIPRSYHARQLERRKRSWAVRS